MQSFKVLEPREIEIALSAIYNLSRHWLRRAPHPLLTYTLGCATYLDAKAPGSQYKDLSKKFNPLLCDNFHWLYQKIIAALSPRYGDMVVHPDLAHPGFHIFGAMPNEEISTAGCRLMEKPIASVHIDIPYRSHMATWRAFQSVDFLNPLSITLCLSLPEHGGGLNTWHKINKKTIFQGHEMIDFNFDRSIELQPQYTPYTPGHIYLSSGHRVHQIAPANLMKPTDRRITLQAHALKCDGVWQLFF